MTQPVKGPITSGFGNRIHPVTGKKSFHNGIDIKVPVGTRVLAPKDGIISASWEDQLGGKSLIMTTHDNVKFGFAHLSKSHVTVGDSVHERQHIADTGNTGRTTGPHLHLTVKVMDKPIDPLKYFEKFS